MSYIRLIDPDEAEQIRLREAAEKLEAARIAAEQLEKKCCGTCGSPDGGGFITVHGTVIPCPSCNSLSRP